MAISSYDYAALSTSIPRVIAVTYGWLRCFRYFCRRAMGSGMPLIVAAICSAVGCFILVTAMLLPSWLSGCAKIGNALNSSESTVLDIINESSPSLTTERNPANPVNISNVLIENAASFPEDFLCTQQGLFMLSLNIGVFTTSLQLIVLREPTLLILASIGMIISIICSGFAFFVLTTAFAASRNLYGDKDTARRNSSVGMILLIIAGLLSIGGMSSFTAGSDDVQFVRFQSRLCDSVGSLLLNQEVLEQTFGVEDQRLVVALLTELERTVNYSYAWYLGWAGAILICFSTISSMYAKRNMNVKSAYVSLNAFRI